MVTKNATTLNDLDAIAPTSAKIDILHPATGEPVGLKFEMVSINDDRVKTVTRRITDKRLKLAAKGKPFTAEELEENEINIISASIIGWEWAEGAAINGEQLEFNLRNVREVLKRDWIRDQLNTALGETERFFQN